MAVRFNNIAYFIEIRGWSVIDFYQHILSYGYRPALGKVEKIVSGMIQPDLELALVMADILECDVKDLFR